MIYTTLNPTLIKKKLEYGGVYIEDIYFFEVNTKYISSSELKTSKFSGVRSTSENLDAVKSRDEIYLVFTDKKYFFFILYNTRAFSYSQSRR